MGADVTISHPRLTPDRVARIAMRWRQGWSLDRMLRAHKDLPRGILRAICAETGLRTDELVLAKKRSWRKWTPEEIKAIRQLFADGVAHSEIAKRIERTILAVKTKAEKLGVEQKSAERATKQEHSNVRLRKCLRCERIFESEGPHNRLCSECRNHGVYSGIASLTTGVGRR